MQPAGSSTSYGTPYCLSTAMSPAGAVELLLLAEELQRALAALVILDSDLGAQRPQAVAAVFGDRNHPALVDGVALCRAVAQHLQPPDPHHRIELGPDHQRAMPHQQPFDGFHRHARPRPGRGIAGRNLAGIGERGFLRGLGLAVDDRDLVAGARQIIGRGDADHATAENNDFHDPSRIRRGIVPRLLLLLASKDQATRLIASPRIETISSIWLFSTIRGGDIAKESPLMRK